MSNSPYISNEVKQYMRKYQIQKLVNSSINSLLGKKPEDPYGFLIGILQSSASKDIQIKNIIPYQTISGEGFPVIKLNVFVNYLNKDIDFTLPESLGIIMDQSVQYESQKYGGKGMGKVVTQIAEISSKILNYKCNNQSQIDKILDGIFQQKGLSFLHAINTISFSLAKIQAVVLYRPLYSIISQISETKISIGNPTLIINCLQGGKVIGSKCKAFKYMIISKKEYKDPYLAQNILLAVRKTIVGGKGGEAALKFSGDGTFICPVDTILDNLKIVEDAINSVNGKDSFGIGISWAADTLYSADTKKYQSQNPKTPFDNDQMIDYLVKLCTDKPIITYLQDPLGSTQLAAWKKLKGKLNDTEALKHIKIGSRNQKILPITLQTFSQEGVKISLGNLSVPATVDTHPDLPPEQINQLNINKFTLDFVQLRLFELRTLSNVIKLSKLLSKTNTRLILQDNLYETYDTSIIDICIGLGAAVSMGSINGSKFDRLSKLNRIKEIQVVGAMSSAKEQK